MSTAVSPTVSSTLFPTDQLTIIVASFSCLVFFVVIVLLLSLLYRKDPLCCKVRAYQDSHGDLEAPSQFYSSRQTLVGSPCAELPCTTRHDNTNTQSGQLFYVGLPSTYRLPDLDPPLPRLPSYESVRKKDRQRQIHMMIADRFGLNGPMMTECSQESDGMERPSQSQTPALAPHLCCYRHDTQPPPTYEESIRQSVQSLDVPFDTMSSAAMPAALLGNLQPPVDALPQYEAQPQSTTSSDSHSAPQPD